MTTSKFSKDLAIIADDQHKQFRNMDEGEFPLNLQIEKYWTELDLSFSNVEEPWSAVFVSWCIKKAGASSSDFRFSASHSRFVYEAIQNTIKNIGVFRGRKISEYKPKIGDILQNNRGGNSFDFEHAKRNKSYQSHSAIVKEIGEDSKGLYLITVGGNEGDSIREKEVRLNNDGFVIQRQSNPFISIIENLK